MIAKKWATRDISPVFSIRGRVAALFATVVNPRINRRSEIRVRTRLTVE